MAMSKSRGNLPPPDPKDPKKCFDVPAIDPKEVQYSTVPVNTDPIKGLDAEEFVKRTVSDLGVMDKDGENRALMLSFIEGSAITCTFYTQLKSDSYGRSSFNTFSETLHPIHQQYRKIHNFQMKLKDQVQFGYDQEHTESGVQGEAVLYPYFCPYQGDMFIYETGANKLGLFKITEPPVRLSIETATCHEIKFILITWVTDEILAKLNACVVDEAYFDLTSYLNSQGALLTSDEEKMQKDVKKAIAVLTHHYVAEYFEQKIYRTFIENACLYDPYIVEFCLRLFNSDDLPMYPVQLKPNPKHWTESFWHMLLDPEYTPEEIVVTTALKLKYGVNYRTVGVTALTNHCYIELNKFGKCLKPYPPFVIPKKFDAEDITVPMQVRLYLSEHKVFPKALLALAKEMLTVRRIAGFYFIPIVIFLLKKLLAALESGDKSIIYQDEEPEPESGCACDCNDCIFSCNPPHLRYMPKCPGHASHMCNFSGDCNSIYIPPCGGCMTDKVKYPDLLDGHPQVVDLRQDCVQRKGWNIGNTPPVPIPHYGPKLPVYQDFKSWWMENMHLSKVTDYMYKACFPFVDYRKAEARFEQLVDRPAGGCSGFRKSKYHARNLDLFYDESAYIIAYVPKSVSTKIASIGICGGISDLQVKDVETGKFNEHYPLLPSATYDGINECGVCVSVNVVPNENPLQRGKLNVTTGTAPGKPRMCSAMLSRYILDNATSVDDAIGLLSSVDLYTATKVLPGYEYHWLVSDMTKSVVIEIINNRFYIHNASVMTNFYLTGYDGDTSNIILEDCIKKGIPRNTTVCEHPDGLERYKYICDELDKLPNPSMTSMMNILEGIFYSKTYKRSTSPFWYTEYMGNFGEPYGNLNWDVTNLEQFDPLIDKYIEVYEKGVRGDGTWRSTHSSVYDLEKKRVMLRVQETADVFTYGFEEFYRFKITPPRCEGMEPVTPPIHCDHPIIPNFPYNPHFREDPNKYNLVFTRPNEEGRMQLIVETCTDGIFAETEQFINTAIDSAKSLNTSDVRASINGFNGKINIPVFRSGIPTSIIKIVVEVTTPAVPVFYRYKWIKEDGSDLGWNIY